MTALGHVEHDASIAASTERPPEQPWVLHSSPSVLALHAEKMSGGSRWIVFESSLAAASSPSGFISRVSDRHGRIGGHITLPT